MARPAKKNGTQAATTQTNGNLAIEYRPITALIPYARNARTHSDGQIAQIASSIREFGWTNPVLVDGQSGIIAGHGRILAAEKLGIHLVPCIELANMSETQRRAYVLADNKLALNAGWDIELLKLELLDLKDLNFNLDLVGFSEEELSEIMAPAATEGLTDPDEAPPVPVEPVTVPGDLWIMGEHRLACGDCTSIDAVQKLMNGKKVSLMNTDPPYGVDYGDVANSRSRAANVKKGGNGHVKRDQFIKNDDLDGAKLQQFLEESIRSALPFLIENPAFYLWHPMLTQGTFFAAAAAAAADILIHRQIIWVKPSLIMGRGDYHWRHELCFYGWIRGKRCRWLRGRDQDTVWNVGRENDHIHPTQKPVELFLRPIFNHTVLGDVIYEPFSGSGSQLIAAEQTGRICHALEIAPNYVDVAVERWQNFTGKQAVLEGDGRTFAEIKAERKPDSLPMSEQDARPQAAAH